MARRIVFTMLALVSALLVIAVVPLGLLATGRERNSFRTDTVLTAQAFAAVAEDGLTERGPGPSTASFLARLRRAGEEGLVYNAAGHLVSHTGPAGSGSDADDTGVKAPRMPAATVSAVLRHGGTVVDQAQGWLRVAVAVEGTSFRPVGVVVVNRSAGELDERLRVLWSLLAAVGAAGLVTGALVAIWFARWVGRPLSALDEAAQQFGGGALDTRSVIGHGPPEVRRLAGTFNTMAGRLEALVHGHQATMADVSHQLRTPLAALRLHLDLLAQDADQATAAELAGAQEEIVRLSRLVDGLLAVVRAENVVVEPVPVAVDKVVRDRVAAWRPVAEEREVTLMAPTSGPVRATLGEGHLEQILDNLIANALDAVPVGGHIQVSARVAGPGAQVVVADDGPGMTQQQREAAFRRFVSSTTGGTGLGLAIVHRLVTSNGGSAALSDTPGGGLTVTLDLPGAQPGLLALPADGSTGRARIPYQS
jgi:signal transduction histidine kinase